MKKYYVFEQGPIRPPSEAASLLLRLSRNCPWNQCTFCPVYKEQTFSIRNIEDVKKDIDIIHKYTNYIQSLENVSKFEISKLGNKIDKNEQNAFYAALNWILNGSESVFLQDANNFILKSDNFADIISYLKRKFPNIKRITSYGRSKSISKMKLEDLIKLKNAGLNRIHIGLESGSDIILKKVKKGVSKQEQIDAGVKVKEAGLTLSEYVMPGLGGADLSIENALETADALNQINPDFIRFRTLVISKNTPLFFEYAKGDFKKLSDIDVAKEIRLFIENLNKIDSFISSDHILNLFENLQGKLPEDKERMLAIFDDFFQMEEEKQVLYQIGRRLGFFKKLEDMQNDFAVGQINNFICEYNIDKSNVDDFIEKIKGSFI